MYDRIFLIIPYNISFFYSEIAIKILDYSIYENFIKKYNNIDEKIIIS